MRELHYKIKGRPVVIHVMERPEDIPRFVAWVKLHPILGYDTETTGLKIYDDDFRMRLAQFGNHSESWVIPVEKSPEFAELVIHTINFVERLLVINAPFEAQVAEKTLGIDIKSMFGKLYDIGITSRLWDSRAVKEGGPGHKLEELTKALICPIVAEEIKGSASRIAKEMRISKEEFFKTVSLDNDEFLLYAGMDPILTCILDKEVTRRIPESAKKLIEYEHTIARICSEIGRNGFKLDEAYTKALVERFGQEETFWQMKIEEFTDDDEFQTGSTADVARVLLDLGWDEFSFTSGDPPRIQVDDALLNRAAESGIEFANWIQHAKKASKWSKTWPQKFLENMDSSGKCHASINTMQARTARMSITGIPAQTLPSSDSLIRSCFVADDDQVMVSVDYSAQELRVAAALSQDKTMMNAFFEGLDLHQITGDAANVLRAVGKMANFLTVYGGGWKALIEQAHIDEATAKRVIKAFNDTYPGVKALSKELADEAMANGYITTPTGRVLKVDRNRIYAAMNYKVQSTSRDITASALIRLDEAGFTDHIKLLIHDEILFNFKTEEAEKCAKWASEYMKHTLRGVEVPTEYKVGGKSWGSLYTQAA